MITLEIPMATPSLNVMLRQHWRVRRKAQQRWSTFIWGMLHAQENAKTVDALRAQMPFDRAKVTITRYSPRVMDTDNLVASVKFVADSLKTCGVIVDDSPKHLDLVVNQEKGRAWTRIKIEQLN